MGYADLDDFITHGLQLDPVMVGWALDGLRRLTPDEAVSFERAVQAGRLRLPGRPRKDEENPSDRRVFDGKYGDNPAYLTARLARDHPDILQRLQAGDDPSVRAEAKAESVAPKRHLWYVGGEDQP